MQVREIMTPDPACCTRGTMLPEVARMMVDEDCGAIPVVDDMDSRQLVGIVTDRDIVCRAVADNKNPLDLTAESCMSSSVVAATLEDSLEECRDRMEEHKVRRIPVVDQKGACCGIVAQADVAARAGEKETAEIVKEVSQPSQAASST